MDKTKSSAFEPLYRFFRWRIFIGALLVLAGVAYAAGIGGPLVWFVTSFAFGMGGWLLGYGMWGLRTESANQVLSSSAALLQTGKLAEASALLDTLDRNTSSGVVMRRHLQRAILAERRGDLDAAELHADRAFATPPRHLVFRLADEAQRSTALGLRAWVRAAKGDVEGGMEDVRAVRASSAPAPGALALASLAEAMVLERRGDRTTLGALLRRDRRLLMGGLEVRQRAVVRAMQRLLKAPPKSIYRTAAEPKSLETKDEPAIAEWLSRVAPELSAFAPRRHAGSAEGAHPVLRPSKKAVARLKAQVQHRPSIPLWRVLVLWGVLVLVVVGLVNLPGADLGRGEQVIFSATTGPLSALWGILWTVLVGARFFWALHRIAQRDRKLQELTTAVTLGQDVDSRLAETAASRYDFTAAQAELLRVAVADRRGELQKGLEHADRARARLRTPTMRAAASSFVTPALTGARAYLLAAMGRDDEAAAELTQIPPDYIHHEPTRFSVRLIALVVRGDIEGAARLVEATPPELPIGSRDELVRDLVCAVSSSSGVGAAEIVRLRDELREDEESRRWIEQVAPELLARFAQITTPDDEEEPAEEEPSSGEEASAEEEAAAAEEAATAEEGATVKGSRLH
jgi:hypothetical protein